MRPEITYLFTNISGMDKKFHPILYNVCNYLSMLGLDLIHVSGGTPGWHALLTIGCQYGCQLSGMPCFRDGHIPLPDGLGLVKSPVGQVDLSKDSIQADEKIHNSRSWASKKLCFYQALHWSLISIDVFLFYVMSLSMYVFIFLWGQFSTWVLAQVRFTELYVSAFKNKKEITQVFKWFIHYFYPISNYNKPKGKLW